MVLYISHRLGQGRQGCYTLDPPPPCNVRGLGVADMSSQCHFRGMFFTLQEQIFSLHIIFIQQDIDPTTKYQLKTKIQFKISSFIFRSMERCSCCHAQIWICYLHHKPRGKTNHPSTSDVIVYLPQCLNSRSWTLCTCSAYLREVILWLYFKSVYSWSNIRVSLCSYTVLHLLSFVCK